MPQMRVLHARSIATIITNTLRLHVWHSHSDPSIHHPLASVRRLS